MKYSTTTIACTLLVLIGSVGGQEVIPSVAARFDRRGTEAIPDFQRHVVPLLGRLGCNSAKCHGSFQGQGNFRLSLFGFDFQADHSALHAAASSEDGKRLDVHKPEESLIALKPTEQIDHDGGKRFELGSWEHNLLLRWIESGALGADIVDATSQQGVDIAYSDEQVTFFKERIQPLLESNCHECHGYSNPKASLRLTSRQRLLAGGDSGAAIVPSDPNKSLLIQAVRYGNDDLKMPPNGKLKQREIADLEKWVRIGAPWPDRDGSVAGDTNQVLVALHYEPDEIVFPETGETSQIVVIAEWASGEREDVTCLSRFQTNDDAVVRVDRNGLATSVGEGDTHIITFYDNGIAAIPVLRPYKVTGTPSAPDTLQGIDRFVNAKLGKLGLVPSELCTDAEFLRRVSIDMTGTLPTPDEVIAFLADKSADKRTDKIDELLQRPAYAAWWANKLCDFSGCNPTSIQSLLEVATEVGYVRALEWYDWIYERVDRNEPYDELVEGIMLARLTSRDEGMPYFWTRQSLKQPKDTAISVAHAFLGIQLQCAECHKHPFDRWTQADFNDFARFFDSVTTSKRRSAARDKQEIRLLRSHVVALEAGDDPRKPIMDWMRDKNNPWFARAFVNRVWAGYFNVGIVDPPDQFTPANPPSNPGLLDWLTAGFIENNFDMRWLHRTITNSRAYQRSWRPNATNRNDRRNFSRAIPRRIPAEVVYDALKQATASTDKQDLVRTNLQRRASGHLSMRMAGTHAMKVFGKTDRSINCDCQRVNEPTLLQAIFIQNDPLVRMRLTDSEWIIQIEDDEATQKSIDEHELIQQVWLRTVNRPAIEAEVARSVKHINSVNSVAEGISDLMWAMINTKEFILNH
ncbi:MAG TPA: DUF1549 domain-containing protein [Planctomycetaceae bacterium]|nr:DUF1549 domain-containing protein [Planctomycetaceae bacterium]